MDAIRLAKHLIEDHDIAHGGRFDADMANDYHWQLHVEVKNARDRHDHVWLDRVADPQEPML